MATTTQNNNRAKFLELRANGKSVADARNATYWPAPVVPDATPTPVTPTSQINQDQLAKNQANRQAQIATWEVPAVGQQPAPIVNAPVDPTTGLSTPLEPVAQPVQPAPVVPATPAPLQAEVKTPEVKPVVASSTQKTEAPIDYNKAQGREQDIINNLNTFKAQNMTPEQIMKASDYQNATPEKKAIIEPYLKQQVPTASAMYNNIVAKADIPDEQKTSLPYKIANNRYTKANMYSTMTPSQLSSEMTNSKLIQGSQAYEDLKAMNPKLVQDTENLRIVNGSKQNVFTYINNPDGTPVKVNNLENTFAQDYIDNFGDTIKQMYAVQTPEEIRAIINTPDVVAAQDKATEIELTMNELEKQIDQVDTDVENEMKWSGATGSRMALEKAIRKDKLEKEYNSQLKNYTTYANKANNLITQNTTLYTTSQAQKLAQNNAMLPILQDQYKTAQAKAKAEADLKDPAIQIKNTIEEFAKLGIVAQWDLTSKIAEYETSGKTLPEYISGLRTQFMSKPEYQKIKELQMGQLSDAQKMTLWYQQDINKMAISNQYDIKRMWLEQDFQMAMAQAKNVTSNKWTKLDDGMYTNEAGEIITADELKSAKLLGNSYITKQVWEEGGECGFYASRWVGMSSTPWGNSKEARTQAFSDKTPQVWWMAFFGGAGYDPTYWHIAIVTGVNQDGTINVKESNYSGTGKVTERTVPASQVTGYYNNTPLAKWVSQPTGTQWEYTDQNINDLAYLDELQTKNPTQAAKDMKELGYSARDLANYKAGNLPLTEKQKNTSTEVMNAIKDLTDSSKYEWNDAVGKFDPKRLIWTQDAEDATIAINNLVAKMTLPNLWVLKWPMSDKDIQFIKEASTKLDTRQSNASFERNLIDAYNLSARRAGMPEIKKLSDLKSGTKSTVGGELDYSKYE